MTFHKQLNPVIERELQLPHRIQQSVWLSLQLPFFKEAIGNVLRMYITRKTDVMAHNAPCKILEVTSIYIYIPFKSCYVGPQKFGTNSLIN